MVDPSCVGCIEVVQFLVLEATTKRSHSSFPHLPFPSFPHLPLGPCRIVAELYQVTGTVFLLRNPSEEGDLIVFAELIHTQVREILAPTCVAGVVCCDGGRFPLVLWPCWWRQCSTIVRPHHGHSSHIRRAEAGLLTRPGHNELAS